MSKAKHELPSFLEYEETLGSLFHAMERNYQEGNMEVDIIRTIAELNAIKMEIAKASEFRFDEEMLSTGTGLEVVFSLYEASINGSNRLDDEQIKEVIENSVKAENLEELRNNADEQINYFFYYNIIPSTLFDETKVSPSKVKELIEKLQELEDISEAEQYLYEVYEEWEEGWKKPKTDEEAVSILIKGVEPFRKYHDARVNFWGAVEVEL